MRTRRAVFAALIGTALAAAVVTATVASAEEVRQAPGTAAVAAGSNWTGWSQIPGGGTTPDAPSSVTFGGKQRLFIRGQDNGIYVNIFDGSTWSGFNQVPGGAKTPSGPSAVEFNSKLYLFVRGLDDSVWDNVFDGATWCGWNRLSGPSTTPSGPAAVVYNGSLRLLVRGEDN